MKIRDKLVTWRITLTVFNGIFLVKKKKSFLSFLFINLKLIIKTSLSENDNPCSLFQALGVMVLTFGLWLLFDRNNLFGVLCEYI